MTTTYAPLFDDADLATLAGRPLETFATTSPNSFTLPASDTRQFATPAWTGYPDIASRIIHDRQFMDLSERYDQTEPSDDDLAAQADRDRLFIILGTAAAIIAQVCFVGYALASMVW